MSDEPEINVVTFSSVLDETPEGMFRMDRLEAKAREEREAFAADWGEEALRMQDEMWAEVERKILFGDGT